MQASNETYLDVENNQKSVEEQLRERITYLESLIADTKEEIEIIESELQSVLDALQNAVENGVQLNIGIVVGQTMSKLSDIIGK
jgi:D-serine dehydratase